MFSLCFSCYLQPRAFSLPINHIISPAFSCSNEIVVSSVFAASQRLPGPHEVVFYSETEDSPGVMLWRYPEPRVLTFVRITPVPFNTTEDPEISTADLGDVLQVDTYCIYGLDMNVNVLFFQHKPQLVVKQRVVMC